MHYFRIVPEYWRDTLLDLKAMGCNTVETYVPDVYKRQGLPYSPQNCRLLLRAIYWAAAKEDEMKKYYVDNVNAEVAAFEAVGKIVVINNSLDAVSYTHLDVYKRQALFCPNGTWLPDEMSEAPRAEGFKWGFMALPKVSAEGDSYSSTSVSYTHLDVYKRQ